MKTTTLTDVQLNEAIRRAHMRYYDAIDAALKAGLDVKVPFPTSGIQTTTVNPDSVTAAHGDSAYRIVVRPGLTVTRTFQ